MAIWRATKPVIAQLHGWCVGGAATYALLRRHRHRQQRRRHWHPYSRNVGAYLTGMWMYRLSLAKAKWHALTGRPLTGVQAAEIELINEAVPVRPARGARRRDRRRTGADPGVAATGAEADRQPGLREHGPGLHPDAGGIIDGLMRNTPRRSTSSAPRKRRVHGRGRAPRRAVR